MYSELQRDSLLRAAIGIDVAAEFTDGPLPVYASDAEYLQSIKTVLLLHNFAEKVSQTDVNRFLASDRFQFSDAQRRLLAETAQELEARIECRLAASEYVPRVIRLANLLDLSDRERRAIEYMVLYIVSDMRQLLYNGLRFDAIKDACQAAGMSAQGTFRFVDPKRKHMVEGLFEVESRLSSSVLGGDFEMADEVVKALVGGTLDVDTATVSSIASPASGPTSASDDELDDSLGDELHVDDDDDDARLNLDDVDGDVTDDLLDSLHEGETMAPASAVSAHDTNFSYGDDPLSDATNGAYGPYRNDLEYLQDQFEYIANRIKIAKTVFEEDRYRSSRDRSPEAVLRELRARERQILGTIENRLRACQEAGNWLPRFERLARDRALDRFEQNIVLTLAAAKMSPEVRKLTGSSSSPEVSDLLEAWCSSFQERIACRRHFYRTGTLVREGIINVSCGMWGDLDRSDVELDPRMLDFIAGLDIESENVVEGSHLYLPTVDIEQVVLPQAQKKLIVDTVSGFGRFRSARRRLGFDELLSGGGGITLLFYGTSGTGKTMMANALAAHLGLRVLLINFPSLGGMVAGEIVRSIFREARLNKAIVFFDECESIFESRDRDGSDVITLLTEMERFDGIVIMATNRPFDLDEAMHRRITLAVEFREPDTRLRESIWRNHLPVGLPLAADVDLGALAQKFELSGGYIKNAVLSALSLAVARDEEPIITAADLEQGARLQLRSRLKLHDFDRRVVPTCGLERNVLFSQWGFDQKRYGQGIGSLFWGPPGTGKSLAAEAVAYETGKPMMVVNAAELVSRYVGDTGKNIETLFKTARTNGAVLVFEEAEGLFGTRTDVADATDRYANLDIGLLLYHLERFPGIVILTTNKQDTIDEAFFRRLQFNLEFPMPDAWPRSRRATNCRAATSATRCSRPRPGRRFAAVRPAP